MSPQLEALFLRSVAATAEKQAHLSALIGQRPWQVDLAACLIAFGDDLRWQIQLLGTESLITETWLWAWANPVAHFPSAVVAASQTLRQYGANHGLEELSGGPLPLAQLNGHDAAVIATGVLGAAAYYRGPYQGGAAYFLITDPAFPAKTGDPVLRLTVGFPQATAAYPIGDHRAAFEGFVEYLGLRHTSQNGNVTVQRDGATVATASFDQQKRLVNLSSHLGP
jgi:hypothetical protein